MQSSLEESAVEYLDRSGALQKLIQDCRTRAEIESHQDKPSAVFRFVLTVDPMDLVNFDSTLGNLVLHYPLDAGRIFQDVVYLSIKALDLIPQVESRNQILVHLSIPTLPPLPSYSLHLRDLSCQAVEQRYFQFEGIVSSMTNVIQYTQSARYQCPESGCVGSEPYTYIRLHTAGASESRTIRPDFQCHHCGNILEEDVSCRVLADKRVLYWIPTIDRCRGDITISIEANSIVKQVVQPSPSVALPDSVTRLYQDRLGSPYSFAASLAFAFASSVSPPGTYHKLKLSMLLSLVSTQANNKMKETKDSGGLHVMAVGSDTLLLSRLLTYCAAMSSPCVHHTVDKHLFAKVTKDTHGTGTCSIDAGSLLLSHGGCCFLGDLGQVKRDVQSSLQGVMEKDVVTVQIPKKYGDSGVLQSLDLPIRCSIWAYTDPNSCRKPAATAGADLFLQQELGNVSKTLADCFSLVCYTDSTSETGDMYADSLLVEDILNCATLKEEDLENVGELLSAKDIKQFLQVACCLHPQLTPPAEYLLQGYFISSRRLRSNSIQSCPFPPTALRTLTSVACAHAKLSLRTYVAEEDALVSISLFEESVTSRYGYSILGVQPTPHFRHGNIVQYLGKENDTQMEQFHLQLLRLISSHAQDLTIRQPEE
ncbi:minichromosome maintenance domain-containing protein 2-like [Branchiostoma floridae]|uniref:Minichromosome maintenance domain-containing protein 2 n=1 Tax=Branchiostoma floridae TaxID=7739 RepID=A0A9J7HT15_BRAFL|nr:minichromosome maintenance domain-containing protein 2-like [Branchiostoma floridae]